MNPDKPKPPEDPTARGEFEDTPERVLASRAQEARARLEELSAELSARIGESIPHAEINEGSQEFGLAKEILHSSRPRYFYLLLLLAIARAAAVVWAAALVIKTFASIPGILAIYSIVALLILLALGFELKLKSQISKSLFFDFPREK